MHHLGKCFIALQLCVVTIGAAQQGCPGAPSRRVAVAPNVTLQVVEWGGEGEALLFLSGLAITAYAFDDFAPLFTDSYRTIGVTRRGIPPSDSSCSGYAIETFTDDIVAVMDTLGIMSAHIVGWSFGGNEAVALAVAKPDRVRSVILLDSYDISPESKTFADLDTLKFPSFPITPFDSTSVLAWMWRQRRLGERPLPLSAICAENRFSKDGRYLGPSVRVAVKDSIIKGTHSLSYSSITKPVLAIFATTYGVGDLFPTYGAMNDSDRALADLQFQMDSHVTAAARARVRKEVAQVTVVEIPGASHAIFNSHPEMVFLEIRKFLNRVRAAIR
jgi:non-heme chloroperoxidase